ncbi:NAD(P)/FAD-dependent oxidoreductase [Aeromicrobium camelliae]|uniref:NAD(P)/FAD-dependent oxidoreductase n=1 Tax=Aeromicrobium camelliae TaxID=1538144 RepID=A0A3N6WMG0_9ACTN|nr:bifunctional NAD(P)/FAD-dependent oxidoreductase/class I SAM-dependent methyltransferase [Aeromicrobium camelliae]RQN08756.1 NAD(P)/FAD-dependent oxidoreductase [Aeromicrobium camelliae]
MEQHYDVLIVGGSAAGLSAALTLGRAMRRVAVIDAGEPRNRFAPHMHAVLGNEGAEPGALLRKGREEAAAYGVTFVAGTALAVDADDRTVTVATDQGDVTARALIVATGLTDELPSVPGLVEHWGTAVLHCPYCHGWEVRGRRIGVLGGSPMSTHQAQLVRQWTDQLTFFTAGDDLDPEMRQRLRARGVEVIDTPVSAVLSDDGRFAGVRLDDGQEIALDALFAAPTPRPHDEFLAGLDLERADSPVGSFISVDPTGQTSHRRIWAAGNVVNPGANVPISIAAGVTAGAVANMALVTEDFDDAVAGRTDRAEDTTPEKYWEGRYANNHRVWSGRVNPTTADVVAALGPGEALDLGCGEGGDAVWLAEHGWQVTAVDISSTAVTRGADGARQRGVGDRITWIAHDLASWQPEGSFDLVTASFFHSTVELPRTQILQRAAAHIRPGGHLLLVSHVFENEDDIPPWAWRRDPDADVPQQEPALLTPAEEVAELALDPSHWEVVIEEIRRREAVGPDGQTAKVKDGVVLLRRMT